MYSKAKKLLAEGSAQEGAEVMAEAALLMGKEEASEKQALRLVVAAAVASRALDVSGKGLGALPEGAEEAAPALQSLDIKGNSLTSLATPQCRTFFGACAGLRRLDASSNKIAAPLPPEVASAPLQHLCLAKNALAAAHVDGLCSAGSLSRLPLGMNLRELDLSNNRMRTLPVALFDLRRLEALNVSYNALAPAAADDVPWPRLAALTVLVRLSCLLTCFSAGTPLPRHTNPDLLATTAQVLSNNKLEGLGCVAYLPKLATLDVSHNSIKRLPEELGACPNLTAVLVSCVCLRHVPVARGSLTLFPVYCRSRATRSG